VIALKADERLLLPPGRARSDCPVSATGRRWALTGEYPQSTRADIQITTTNEKIILVPVAMFLLCSSVFMHPTQRHPTPCPQSKSKRHTRHRPRHPQHPAANHRRHNAVPAELLRGGARRPARFAPLPSSPRWTRAIRCRPCSSPISSPPTTPACTAYRCAALPEMPPALHLRYQVKAAALSRVTIARLRELKRLQARGGGGSGGGRWAGRGASGWHCFGWARAAGHASGAAGERCRWAASRHCGGGAIPRPARKPARAMPGSISSWPRSLRVWRLPVSSSPRSW